MNYDEPTRVSAFYQNPGESVRYSTVFPNDQPRQSVMPVDNSHRFSTFGKMPEPVRKTMVVQAPQPQQVVVQAQPQVQQVVVQSQPQVQQVVAVPQPLKETIVEVEKPIYMMQTQLYEDTQKIEILHREIEKYRNNYDHLISKSRSVEEYSTRLREYDQEVRRLQAIILGRARQIEELKLTMIDPNEFLNLKQLVQQKNDEIQQLKRGFQPYEDRMRDYGHLENEIRRLTDLLNARDREISELRNRTQGKVDTTYYDRQIAELNRLVRVKDFEIEAMKRQPNIVEGPSVKKMYVDAPQIATSVMPINRSNFLDSSNIVTSQYLGRPTDNYRPLHHEHSRRVIDDNRNRLYESSSLRALDLNPGTNSNYQRRFRY